MQHGEQGKQVKQFNPASFSRMAGGRLLAGLAILAAALTVSGCSRHVHTASTTRTVVVTRAYHGPYVGVQRVYFTGLYITIILVGGHTVYLPDDIYHHPDGYQIIISGGRVIALDGIPSGLLVASTRPGARRGRPFRGGRVAITSIQFDGDRMIFVDGYGARISLPAGHYQGRNGHRLDFGDGRLRQVALNPAAPQQTQRPPKSRRVDSDRDRPAKRRRGEASRREAEPTDRRSDRRDERPERREAGSSDRRRERERPERPERREAEPTDRGNSRRGNSSADREEGSRGRSNSGDRGNSDRGNSDRDNADRGNSGGGNSASRGSSGRGNFSSSNSAGKKTDQPSGNKGVGKQEDKSAGKGDDKKEGKSDKKKDEKKSEGEKDEKKKPSEDDDSPPR